MTPKTTPCPVCDDSGGAEVYDDGYSDWDMSVACPACGKYRTIQATEPRTVKLKITKRFKDIPSTNPNDSDIEIFGDEPSTLSGEYIEPPYTKASLEDVAGFPDTTPSGEQLTWTCSHCHQVNASWVSECGRCELPAFAPDTTDSKEPKHVSDGRSPALCSCGKWVREHDSTPQEPQSESLEHMAQEFVDTYGESPDGRYNMRTDLDKILTAHRTATAATLRAFVNYLKDTTIGHCHFDANNIDGHRVSFCAHSIDESLTKYLEEL